MPVKSLELVGYKTFATKTTFEFSSAITAIVGPNGSGKSNIADALRWVLGEQSYSLLRGKKTVDMIFSGSDQRSRAGMASATVTFDNADGWLPIDFSEVAVTRRAYRDGQNEYLINGQKVRLRDVAELLARSGLAERTYTIIGQGLVDAALSLKPEERRKLFEEAAGIGVYRARREEALKRLDTTRRNLERVQDILAELKPRLNSLDRQARRAAEFEQIRADLHVLLREWYGYHWHRQQQDLTSAREAARAQETILIAARGRQATFNKQIDDLREKVHNLRSRLAEWHRDLGAANARKVTLTRELAVAQERLRAAEERDLTIRAEKERAKEDVRLHEDRHARASEEATRLERRVAEAGDEHAQAHGALAERQRSRESALDLLDELERSLQRDLAEEAAHTARLEENAHRIAALRQVGSELEKELARLEGALAKARTAEERIEAEWRAASDQYAAAKSALASQEAAVLEVENERAALIDSRRGLQADLAKAQAQAEVLRQAEHARAGHSDGARLLLQAAGSGQVQGVLAALSSVIEVQPSFETATAAALGQYIDALLVDSARWIDGLLDALNQAGTDGTLVPLDTIDPGSWFEIPEEPGCLGILSDFIQAPEEVRPAISLLLGRFVVAEDRPAARRLRSELPDSVGIVTLSGDIFSAGGVVAAGGHGRGALLARARKRREFDEQVVSFQRFLEKAEISLAEAEKELARRREKRQRTFEEVQAAAAREEDERSALRAARGEIDQLERQMNWHRSQLTQQHAEIRQAESSLDTLKASLGNLSRRLEERREAVAEERERIDEVPFEDLVSQANHWSTQLAVAQQSLDDARIRSGEKRQALDDARRHLASLGQQLEALVEEKDKLESDQARIRTEEQAIDRQIAAARSLIDPAEKELTELEARQDSARATETEARQALSMAERNHAQAQITLARRQEALDGLRQRIEDDFGLVAFEYEEEVPGPTPLPLGELVESLPVVSEIAPELGDSIRRQRAQLRRMGAVNPEARREHREVKERFEFLTAQVEDLTLAEQDILETVRELDLIMEREFRKTFDAVAREFREIFTRLFGGGTAHLVLTQPDDMTETGVDIEARLPGRRAQGLSLLSGGERSLTATALVFSLIRVSPTPFCVLDEVDAMLDEANVNRFAELLRELSERTQFIVITHNRNTVQSAETIYGITMGRDSTSQILGLKLDESLEMAAAD